MLIAAERLLLKLRQPRSRADELIALHDRLRTERGREVDAHERELARTVLANKLDAAAELGAVASCSSCADGEPWPRGAFAGGDCCSGVTADLFDDHELAALAHAGTRVRDLVAPRGEHPGCAFRGDRGCTLAVEHRPGRCVHYVCDTLRRELHDRGRLDAVEAKLAALNQSMQAYTAVHRDRVDREILAPLVAAIERART